MNFNSLFSKFLLTNLVLAIDVASGEYGDVLSKLVDGVENGKRIYQENSPSTSALPSIREGMSNFAINFQRNSNLTSSRSWAQ